MPVLSTSVTMANKMRAALAAAAALWAAFLMPAFGQQIVCVPDAATADGLSRNAGEELAWQGETSGGVGKMRFYLGRDDMGGVFRA